MNRRNFLFSTAAATTLWSLRDPAWAQMHGHTAPPPMQTLPGPFGPYGMRSTVGDDANDSADDDGDEDDDSKKKADAMADASKDLGTTIGAGGGAIATAGGVFGSATSWTGIGGLAGLATAGFGTGLMLGGGLIYGVGGVLKQIAHDPPRPDYTQDPNCKIVKSGNLSSLGKLDSATRSMVDKAFRLYASSANTLASLEYWQGAHAKDDGAWRKRHRQNFVTHWKQMRKDLISYSQSVEPAVSKMHRRLSSAGVSVADLEKFYTANAKDIRQQSQLFLNNIIGEAEQQGLTESDFLRDSLNSMPLAWSGMPTPQLARKKSQGILLLSKKLPVYK